jgi:hypothetical protein
MKRVIFYFVLVLTAASSVYSQQYNEEDFDFRIVGNQVEIIKYKGTNKEVRIPSLIQNRPVTKICEDAFAYAGLTRVNIPDSVKIIEQNAFARNPGLVTIKIGGNVSLGNVANPAFSDIFIFHGETFNDIYNKNQRKAGIYYESGYSTAEEYLNRFTRSQNNLSSSNFLFQDLYDLSVARTHWASKPPANNSAVKNIGFSLGKILINQDKVVFSVDDSRYYIPQYIIPESALAALGKKELWQLRYRMYYMAMLRTGPFAFTQDLDLEKADANPDNNPYYHFDFTEAEKINIRNILVFENASPASNLRASDIVGKWMQHTGEIIINSNNTIEYNLGGGEDNFKGTYRIENGFLVVLVTQQYVGSSYANYHWFLLDDMTYRDGIVYYEKPIRMVFPVGVLNNVDGQRKRQIGSIEWTLSSN